MEAILEHLNFPESVKVWFREEKARLICLFNDVFLRYKYEVSTGKHSVLIAWCTRTHAMMVWHTSMCILVGRSLEANKICAGVFLIISMLKFKLSFITVYLITWVLMLQRASI